MYRRFGSEATVIQRDPRVVSREDEDVSHAVREIVEREGVTVCTDTGNLRIEEHGGEIAIQMMCGRVPREVVGSHLLVATGRRLNTNDLGLSRAGVQVNDRGYIEVDSELKTNVPGIWAIGDCNGRGAFTHTSYNDFEIVAANLLDGGSRRISDRILSYALYIDSPLARVGMTERQVRASGRKALMAKK